MEVFDIANKKQDLLINEQIKASNVLVIGPNGEQVGVKSLQDALTLSSYANLDLVLMNPNSNPPVCKVMDYNKFRYEKNKKEKVALKRQKANMSETKEFRLSSVIDVGDFETKLRQVTKYLQTGDIYKFYNSINEIDKDASINNFAYDVYNKFKNNVNFECNSDASWTYIKSGDLLGEKYRIYLNLKKKQKAEFIEKFAKICEDNNIPYHFKFSKFDARLDEIVILSNEEEMEKYLEYIESITNEMDLEKVPTLAGIYNGKNIGVTCENVQNTYYSYTESRIRKIPETIRKFFIENFEQYKELMNDDEIETIDFFIEEQKDDIKYYQQKNDLESLNIVKNNLSREGLSTSGDELIPLAKRCIVSNEKLLDKLCSVYREVCNIYGYSKNIIFNDEKQRDKEVER